jgi:hypothetical protein
MRGSRWLGWGWLAVAALWAGDAAGQAVSEKSKTVCRRVVFEGEVKAGAGFVRAMGGGLEVRLDPIAAGWVVRVLPVGGARPAHDYAELATPPYGSVNPLLVSTDFGFRAQDAVGWNPRRFQFAADAAEFGRLSAAYGRMERENSPAAEAAMAQAAAGMHEGEVRILDARLVPGTANQAPAAALVAGHFSTTAHTVEQSPDGRATPLGRVTWMRFRMGMDVPAGFRPASGMGFERRACP